VLRFISAPPAWRQVEHYAEPIFAAAQLQAAWHRLAARLCDRMTDATLGATELTARFYRIDRQCPAITLGFAAPCRDEFQSVSCSPKNLDKKSTPALASRPSLWRPAR
jgi:protein ImuB